MTAIEVKEAAQLLAKVAQDQVKEAMKTLVNVRVIHPCSEQDVMAITRTLQRAYDQLAVGFDLEVKG
ncbi:hypothetical protein PP298_08135 [Mycobacteroides abscessus]|uniref:hypothetical protein n=1 Tax=Mycobacteroides abscessus TaxID=36809 RepID=UPI00078DF4B6|nr:hypothetical protein [Mycobacteroides abscessus]AMU71465.1 hypothetical protein A3O05_16510 [Mycobacteroides abscessus]MDM2015310.1 hypothetical protein [Mycobacteroides abscessus]MDM2019688.1 hypothetical protein [Mycobacteroides abscessus]MDM2025103.1 hypothetical protein [Mycobacteroides abscessus]MDM2027774.1 hypothetical protein [Mycobacteroides abscessus]